MNTTFNNYLNLNRGIKLLSLPLSISASGATIEKGLAMYRNVQGSSLIQKIEELAQPSFDFSELLTYAMIGAVSSYIVSKSSKNIEDALIERSRITGQNHHIAIDEARENGEINRTSYENENFLSKSVAGFSNGMIKSLASTLKPAINLFSKNKMSGRACLEYLDNENLDTPASYLAGQFAGYVLQGIVLLDTAQKLF